MNIASILMDLAVVLIVIWQVRRGYHNGLMRMLIECLSWLAAAVLAVMISYAISGTIYDMFFAGRITEAVTNAILEAGSPEAFAGSLEQTLASMPEAIRSAAEFLMGGVDLSAVTSAQAAELAQTVTDSIVRPLITSAIQLVSFLILFALLSLFIPGLTYLDRVVSFVAIAVFLGYTAYDTQKIKAYYHYYAGDPDLLAKASIFSALQLYLDFLNLFVRLLSILGKRRN